MSIDRTDPRSPSRQIAAELRAAIQAGEIAPGNRLPSERELVEKYGIAAQTARNAVAILKAEGLVEGQAGRGVFVRKEPPLIRMGTGRFARWRRAEGKATLQAEAEDRGSTWRTEMLQLAEVPAPEWVAQWFEIEPETPVFVRRRRMWVDDSPTQLADSYHLLEDVQGTRIMQESTGPGGTLARFEDKGLAVVRFREEIKVRMPAPDEARGLRLGLGVPVAEMHRITFTSDRPIEVFQSIMAGNRHIFAYEFDAPE